MQEESSSKFPRKHKTLSVYMSNYNDGHLLKRALEAFSQQTVQPDEILIIDDASTDNSVEIINKYKEKIPSLRLIINSSNKGLMANIADIENRLQGDYLYGAAADDYVSPNFFANAMHMADLYPHAGIIFGQVAMVNEDEQELYLGKSSFWNKPLYADPAKYFNEYLSKEPPMQSLSAATIYRREALTSIGGFPHNLDSWTDTFALRACALQYGACYLPQKCVTCRIRNTSFSQQKNKHLKQSLSLVKKMHQTMNSGNFINIFPPKYSNSWRRKTFFYIIAGHLATFLGITITSQSFFSRARLKLGRILS